MAYARLLERAGRLRGDLNRFQIRLIEYLTRSDERLGRRGREEFLGDLLLIVNPQLHNSIYDDHGNLKPLPEEEAQMRVPETEDDIKWMLEEMKRYGVAA
jgi:hypothetical protein